MLRRLFFIFTLIVLLSVGFSARAYYNPGKPAGFVNDYAGMMSASQATDLNNKLTQFSKDTSNEISVVTIKTLAGDTIENFSNKLFTDWKIGKDKKDNGVLLLIALDERQMRIEPGYGLEGALPDATCFQIINDTLKPAFRANDYYDGISQATDQIISATKGEYTADSSSSGNSANSGIHWSFESIVLLLVVLFNLLNGVWRYLAKSRSWWEGGALGVIVGLLIAAFLLQKIIYFIVLPLGVGILGLIADYLVSQVLPKPKPMKKNGGGFWFFGGGPGGSGGSGGSGGGFGGFGGGGSGGGGSSGGW